MGCEQWPDSDPAPNPSLRWQPLLAGEAPLGAVRADGRAPGPRRSVSLLQPVSVSIGATPASARVPGQALRPPGRSQASRSFKAPARHWTTQSPAPGSGGGTRLLGARRRSVHSWMAAAAFSLSGGFLRVFRHHWLGTRAYQPPRSSRWCQARARSHEATADGNPASFPCPGALPSPSSL